MVEREAVHKKVDTVTQKQSTARALQTLQDQFGAALKTGEAIRAEHAHKLTHLPSQLPDAVIYPNSTQDVCTIVKICADHKFSIIPFGAGTSLEGQLNAPRGGLSIDMSNLQNILQISQSDMDCQVEAGITRKTLNKMLRDTGLFFSVDPGADATLGGMAATNASGTTAVKYGTMRDNVLALKIVTASGEVVTTGSRARKSAAGYDLTRLMIGSEGTLGVITELTLRLHGIPEAKSFAICPFQSVEGACEATSQAILMGLSPARIEFLDERQVRASNIYSGLTLDEVPTLFLEFHGSPLAIREETKIFAEIAATHGGGSLDWSDDVEQGKKLWAARHDAFWAAATLRPGADIFVTDTCVPISRLAECVEETRQDLLKYDLLATILGHVGDGNFHVLALIDADNPKEARILDNVIERLVSRALRMGGTSTGEHGVGQGKQKFMHAEHGAGVGVMQAVKKALDPDDILNPGKLF